jgi:hypothetical protein
MKKLKVRDSNGQPVKGWAFGYGKAVHLVSGQKPRNVVGWTLKSPDGVERFSEGNWQQFVPFANRVIENYGCTSELN